jgi:hypothetical protein
VELGEVELRRNRIRIDNKRDILVLVDSLHHAGPSSYLTTPLPAPLPPFVQFLLLSTMESWPIIKKNCRRNSLNLHPNHHKPPPLHGTMPLLLQHL